MGKDEGQEMKRIIGSVAMLMTLALGTNVRAQGHNGTSTPIVPNDVFVYRVGTTADTVKTNNGQIVFLDEYSAVAISNTMFNNASAPTPYQSVQMPTTWYGGEAPLVGLGSDNEGGLINLSADGRFLVIPGFAAYPGQVSTNALLYYGAFPGSGLSSNDNSLSSAPTTNVVALGDIPRVVALLDGNGHLYMSTVVTGVDEQADDLYSAASLDGTNIWLAGSVNNVKYTLRGSLLPTNAPLALTYGVSTNVCRNADVQSPVRTISIYGPTGSQVLYVDRNQSIYNATNTANSGVYSNLNPFGGSLPVYNVASNYAAFKGDLVGGGTNNLISVNAFFMANLANKGPCSGCPDTIYIADEQATGFSGEPAPHGGGILKFCYVAASNYWQSVGDPTHIGGIAAENAYGVTGVQVGTNVILYATEATNNVMYYYEDFTGYMGNPQSDSVHTIQGGNQGQAGSFIMWNTGYKGIKVQGIAMAPQGGDNGTLSTASYGYPSVGPIYGPYYRGPQGAAPASFQPTNSFYTYSVMNPYSATGQVSVGGSAINNGSLSVSPSGLQPIGANGGSVTFTISPASGVSSLNGGQSYTALLAFNLRMCTNCPSATPLYGTLAIDEMATIVVDAFYLTNLGAPGGSQATNFITSGPVGGAFTPASSVYTLSNATPNALSFSASLSNNWDQLILGVSTGQVVSGSLGGKQATNITVSINPCFADGILDFGGYDDYLTVSNLSSTPASQLGVMPEVELTVGFGFFDNFNNSLEFTNGPVVGQNGWLGAATPSPDVSPVQIVTVNGTNEYVVPGGCGSGTAQQPYKYVSSGPLTNAYSIVGTTTNNVPTYAVTGIVVTFTNAPPTPNYCFTQGNSFLPWNAAGVLQHGGGYVWTTELNEYETGGGPHGQNQYQFNTQYAVFMVSDFVDSNAWVFSFTGPNETGATNDLPTLLSQVPNAATEGSTPDESGPLWFAVWSDALTDCSYCPGISAQAWESITLGQYFGDCPTGPQPGYFVNRVAASTNFSDVYEYIMAGMGSGTPPDSSFTVSCSGQTVSFTDTSSGLPTSWLWNFGDCVYTNVDNPTHTYASPGTYYPTLVAGNGYGDSSIIYTQEVTVPCGPAAGSYPYWQSYYFDANSGSLSGGSLSAEAAGNVDADGTGMSNTNKFMAGFNPTNSAAYLHIISAVKTVQSGSTNIVVTYLGASGDTTYSGGPSVRTNVLDYTTGIGGNSPTNGSYQNSGWTPTGQTNILGVSISAAGGEGTGLGTVTNMTDVGGANATPSRYYRVRVLLP